MHSDDAQLTKTFDSLFWQVFKLCSSGDWIEVVPFLRRILIHARLASILFVTEKRENALVSYDIMMVVVFLFHLTFSTRTRHREEDGKED